VVSVLEEWAILVSGLFGIWEAERFAMILEDD
jgi:hypothetical protein